MTQSELSQLQLPRSGPLPAQVVDDTNMLLPPTRAADRLRHFAEEAYDTSPEGHLARFMMVVLGDAGAGQLRKALLRTRLQQTLSGTHFYALDRFYGAIFDFRRTQAELLAVNPQNQVTNDWQTEHAKDASYRSRIEQFARALAHGATPTGMELVAEAVLSVDCDVYESYIQADGSYRTYGEIEADYATYADMEGVSYGVLEGEGLPVLAGNDRRTFVVRPKRAISQAESYDLLRVLNKVKPADSRVEIDWEGVEVHEAMSLNGIAADSEYWEVVNLIPDPSGPIEPPLPPFSKHQGEAWTYNGDIAGVNAFAITYPRVEITTALNGMVVEVPGADETRGAPLATYPLSTGDVNEHQEWTIEPVGAYYRIVNVKSGQVMDVFEERTTDNTPFIQYPWKGTGPGVTPNQLFSVVPVGAYYVIIAAHSGKVMTATGGAAAPVAQQTYTGAAGQLWSIPAFAQANVISPTQRIYFGDGSHQDYPPGDVILPLRSILAGRIVSDGVLVSGVYGGYRPAYTTTVSGGRTGSYTIDLTQLFKTITLIYADWLPLEIVQLWLRDNPVDPYEFTAARHFWVSPTRYQEDRSVEVVEVKLTEIKLVNYLTFETSRYPHIAILQYFNPDTGFWVEAFRRAVTDSFPTHHNRWLETAFQRGREVGHPEHAHTAAEHWVRHSMKIPRINAQRYRVVLVRGPGTPPKLRVIYGNDQRALPYSLAVRRMEIGYRIDNYDDLLPFKNPEPIATTTNFVGQTVKYAGRHQAAAGLLDNPQSAWRCEPQPLNYAVVNLFLDTRDEDGDPSVIDRFFIDPTHTGCHITIYWSNDVAEPDFDADDGGASTFATFTWQPVPRDYTAQKGFLHLPPVRARWFKFEFTNLVAEPYEVFIPIKRLVRIFAPTTVEESKKAHGGVGDEGRPRGLTPAIAMTQDRPYSDAVETLLEESQTHRADSPTAAFYVRDPSGQLSLKEQSWVYAFTPFTQGMHAPRFSASQVHRYQEVEIYTTSKVAFFCGLNQLVVYRINHEAGDDTEIYTDHYDDFLNLEPGFDWTFNPGYLTSGSDDDVTLVSRPMGSLHNVRAVQFATQQSDPIQLVRDDEFQDPALANSDWTDTDDWNVVGDAQLLYRPNFTQVRVVRHSVVPDATLERVGGIEQPLPSPIFGERPLTIPGQDATYGGLASELLLYSVAGRVHAAARVILETDLTEPLWVQIVDDTDAVLAEQDITGTAGQRLEWYVGWTIPDPLPSPPVARVRVIQKGKTDDSFLIDALSFFDDGITWEFSVNGGSDWYPAHDIRNNPYGILSFPAFGNQLVYRARGVRENVTLSAIRIRPHYVGVANSRQGGTHRGPNVSTYDHEPPIQEDPEWSLWPRPIPRSWFFAYKGLPLLPVEGAPIVSPFARFYGRPVEETVPTPTDAVTHLVIQGRTAEEHLDFFSPLSDAATRAGVFGRTAIEAPGAPTEQTIASVAPGATGTVVDLPTHSLDVPPVDPAPTVTVEEE